MPEQARILQFPARPSKRSSGNALAVAQEYMSHGVEDRQSMAVEEIYRDLDVLLAICGILKERANSRAAEVLAESSRIFAWVMNQKTGVGYFDERDFFLGEAALLAGMASRVLGDRSETELWLDRADGSYRHTINPAASLARVAYVRLSLRHDLGRFGDVLELLPSVSMTFEKLGMNAELGKCRLLKALSLKELGNYVEAVACFESLLSGPLFESEAALRGSALLNLGNTRSLQGDHEGALVAYRAAQPLLENSQRQAMLADLKGSVAETLRQIGQIAGSIVAYRESVGDYLQLGMQTNAAYTRVLLAEALLEAGRPREAEWELLAALPTINEQKMVPEGFAAVALLQQSVKLRKTDPVALAELRKYLQVAN
jgi:tetratricopeptide (TPR) repeat protein